MTLASTRVSDRPARASTWPLVIKLARRELAAGLSGFFIFIACIALGVMVITGVGALSDALRAGFERQGQMILGGDATFSRSHARATPVERAWFDAQGRVSETATLRTMARRLDGEDQALIELRSVDGAYPLVGEVKTADGKSTAEALAAGAIADPILLERLGLKVGDSIRIGGKEIKIAAALVSEPDGLIDRLTYGPRVFASIDTLMGTGLIQPGTLVRWRYALQLKDGRGGTPDGLVAFREDAKRALPEAGFTVTDRRDPSPQVTRTLERLRQFLTLLGLTSLLVGGVGVANAVATFMEKRRKVIATFKSLGATSHTVFAVFLGQIMVMAAIGVAIGLALGLILPSVLAAAYGHVLPIKPEISISLASLATAIAYGFLVALLFSLWPLGRAEQVSASVLFRDDVAPERVWPRWPVMAVMAAAGLALVVFTVVSSDSKMIALGFCGGLIALFSVFIALGGLVTRLARRVRGARPPELALALANLGAPGGLTRSVVVSLGSGLSLLVTVALADASLVNELSARLPTQSPNYFVLDIPKADFPGLKDTVLRQSPAAVLEEAPMLRGRLINLNGKPVEQIKAPPEAEWVLNGDRGLTYADKVPDGSKVVAGSWWPPGYDGEPVVSFEAELAKLLDLKIGDSVTVNVLGRNVSAKITNLRDVKWESLALNFVMVFSPNTLRGAPHNYLATITLPKDATPAAEAQLAKVLGRTYPAATAIRVKDAIDAFSSVFTKIMTAVRVAGSVTLLAGALVLAGALATAQRRRILEAVILKALGATRRRILTAHIIEYLLLAAVTAVFAVALGSLAAWITVTQVMDLEFAFSWAAVAAALALATALVVVFGGIGTWGVLRARPVPYLRSE